MADMLTPCMDRIDDPDLRLWAACPSPEGILLGRSNPLGVSSYDSQTSASQGQHSTGVELLKVSTGKNNMIMRQLSSLDTDSTEPLYT